ncbi:MAG: ABC transporter permease, partial [Phycisphaerae bacterium]|nr:ABC transporter permease [Phycisphaerae bacterium]
WIFMGIALVLTLPFAMTVGYLGDPDTGPIITGYLGSFLMAGGYLAMGCFFSALTKNQIISFILAVVACAILYSIGLPTTMDFLSGVMPKGLLMAIGNLSFQSHFESMQRGVIALGDLSFFGVMIVGWVWACCIILEERKAA